MISTLALRTIVPCVLGAHLLLLFWVIYTAPPLSSPRKKTSLTMQTVILKTNTGESPVKIETKLNLEPELAKPVETLPKPEALPKPETPSKQEVFAKKPTPPPKKVPSKKKPTEKIAKKPALEKKAIPVIPALTKDISKQKELLAKAQKSLSQIETSSAKLPSKKSLSVEDLPKNIAVLDSAGFFMANSDSFNVKQRAYRDELAAALKLYLRLPESGDINLRLTVAHDGGVKKVDILSAGTSNRHYVEENLPRHKMPAFESAFEANEMTFTITMKGE